MRERFGPGWPVPLVTLLGLGCLGYYIRTEGASHELLLLAAGLLALAWSGWVWFDVDEKGIRRRSLLGSSSHRWSEIARVRGRRVQAGGRGDVLIQVVVDHHDHPLFKLNPWLSGRKDLARRIRQESLARRAAGSVGSATSAGSR